MAITFLIIGGNIVLFKNEEVEFQLLKSTKQQKQSPVVLVLKHFIIDFKLHSYLHDRNNGLLISSVRRSHNYCLVFLWTIAMGRISKFLLLPFSLFEP